MCFLTLGRKNGINDDKFLLRNCYCNRKLSPHRLYRPDVLYVVKLESCMSSCMSHVVKHESCLLRLSYNYSYDETFLILFS
jgi:hypothetical protein